jgi:hypothetical protein
MGTLERIDEALWLAEGETISFYGFAYPTRSVVVRLKGSDWFLVQAAWVRRPG